jgi:AraC family transcriptional regulator
MNEETTQKLEKFYKRPLAAGPSSLVDVEEVSATRGDLLVPPVKEVNLALLLSNHAASWRGPLGASTKRVSAGSVALCHFGEPVRFELHDPMDCAVVLLRNEALQQVREETREYLGEDLQPQPALQDPTLRHLMEILHLEKRDGFQNGPFFLDGVATALASYLVRQFSITPSFRTKSKFTGGMSPSTLRRCIEFMDARLDGALRLSELASEAGLSASHFVRSFRHSTGKTPYQYLLLRRVERARTAMRDRRASLAEVAVVSGFADQHHLARVFRRITGLTPSSYRRSL